MLHASLSARLVCTRRQLARLRHIAVVELRLRAQVGARLCTATLVAELLPAHLLRALEAALNWHIVTIRSHPATGADYIVLGDCVVMLRDHLRLLAAAGTSHAQLALAVVVLQVRRLSVLLVHNTLNGLRQRRAGRVVPIDGVVEELALGDQVLLRGLRQLVVVVMVSLLAAVLAGGRGSR